MRRLLTVGILATALTASAAGGAAALSTPYSPPSGASGGSGTSLSDVVVELQRDGVFLEPGSQVGLDEQAAEQAVARGEVPLRVVAVSSATTAEAGGEVRLANLVGSTLRERAVVLVLTDRPSSYAATSSALQRRGISGAAALRAAPVAGPGDADRLVRDVVTQLDAQSAEAREASGTRSTTLLVVLGLVVAALVLAGLRRSLRSRRGRRVDEAQQQVSRSDTRSSVEALYARLGNDVETLAPGDDVVARQALADAEERWTTTGSLLAQGEAPGALEAARRAAEEGLAATRTARERLGLALR